MKYSLAFKAFKYALIAVFLLSGSNSNAQIEFSADTGRIGWGERATISARLGVSASDNILTLDSFPQWTDTITGGLEILEVLGPDTIAASETDPGDWDYVIQKSWVVTAWDSGFVDLPGLQIQKVPTRTGGKNELVVHAEIIDVQWTTTEKIRRAMPFIIALIIALAVIGLGYYFFKKFRHKQSGIISEEPEVLLPEHIVALQKLEQLKARESWLKGDEKTFQVDLSQIIREYIDRRFEVSSLDKTSAEAVSIIRLLDISEGNKMALTSALMLGDQIKFAKFKAAHDMHLKSLNDCIDFVQKTKRDEVD
jgi:hypothetical protein